VASLLSEVYSKAAPISNAANGFQATGPWPIDQGAFSESVSTPNGNLNTPNDILNGDAVVNHMLKEINMRKYKAMHLTLKI
jgi:hypothetical protein